MNSLPPEALMNWNRQGLIPGPDEKEEEFIKRANFCLNLTQELAQSSAGTFPFETSDQAAQAILGEATTQTSRLYGIQPSWIPLFFSDYQLSPWHGGCAWIFQLNEQTPASAFLQLRARFRSKSRCFGLYQRDELIAHEISHVGRMMYQEPKFEEIFAYQTASSKWRKWLGPIVQSSKESMGFILLLGLIVMIDLTMVALDQEKIYQALMWIKSIPFLILFFALARLSWRQALFQRCFKKLRDVYGDSPIARAVMYRLQDKEIALFSKRSPAAVRSLIESSQTSSLRWKWIHYHYPLPSLKSIHN